MRGPGFPDRACRGQALEGGQNESCGLAGAGLSRGDQVVSGEGLGNGQGLDRGGQVMAALGQGFENRVEPIVVLQKS